MKKPQSPPDCRSIISATGNNIEKFISDEELMRAVKKYNEKYLHWDEVRRRDTDGTDPEIIWCLMKLFRGFEQKEIIFKKIAVKYSVTKDFMRSLHEIDRMSSAGIFLEENVPEKSRLIYALSSVMEESIASSQVEGASTTTLLAKKMLREKRKPKDRSERMILNNFNAMKYINEKKDVPLTPEFIEEVHRIITNGTLENDSYEGRFRDTDDIVISDRLTGDVYHQPIPYSDIKSTIDSVCDYINGEEEFEHPLIKGMILHFIIAYIHPFVDGNGRLARALFYWYLLKKGYWAFEFLSISKVIKSHRGKYDMAYLMSETDGNDITYFIKFNLELIEDAFVIFREYVKRKLREQKSLETEIMGIENLNLRQKSILRDIIKTDEPFSVYYVKEKYQISYQTARTDILKLMGLGHIKISGREGNMILYSYNKKDD
jgi:Fic family protein